ncbi:VCBS domain-containing protein [Mesorhizobium opportunistum]|uniref:VCBS domain-containing protein n=1 Tax=Mesorhizobium opportunistum TaxID=593909 RepID=UPI002575036E|nr:VCBS domain-containing protein [Mesorhizobium opportunistum]WJI38707.1 VCBS domain-containing protein [Mesorhizobium opportunistum]
MSSLDGHRSQTITVTIHAPTTPPPSPHRPPRHLGHRSRRRQCNDRGDAWRRHGGRHADVHDVDAGQAHFAAVAPAALAGTYGNFSFDSATGVWGYTLDNSKAADRSAQRRRHPDRHAHRELARRHRQPDITVTIHGTNDAATITASATEDTSVTEAGAGNATTAATPGDARRAAR